MKKGKDYWAGKNKKTTAINGGLLLLGFLHIYRKTISATMENSDNKIIWYDLLDAKDAFQIMHTQWRLIIDKLVVLKEQGILSKELFSKIMKDEITYTVKRFPHYFPKLPSI